VVPGTAATEVRFLLHPTTSGEEASMARHESGLIILQHPLGHFEATVSTTPLPLPGLDTVLAAQEQRPERIRRVVIRNSGQPMVWTDDGSTPSSTHGMYSLADEVLIYDGSDLSQLQFIRAADATADVDLRVAFYGT
jgi:hypothetical protein